MSLVFDLRLNKPPPDDPNMLPIGGRCLVPDSPARSLEERRGVLGCFVMSSMFISRPCNRTYLTTLVFLRILRRLMQCSGPLIWKNV